MPHYKLAVGRFPYGGTEHTECVDWLIDVSWKLSRDPRFTVCFLKENDTPITMTRNKMFQDAIRMGADFLLIVDSDMAPDVERGDPEARPFLESSLQFVLDHPGPCVVAAPYCGPPPHENVYVFQWLNRETGVPVEDAGLKLDQFTREQAALMRGITEVAALPTGLMLIDVRALKALPAPHTYYEYAGDGPACQACDQKKRGPEVEKISTEDVTFTRDLSMAGVKVYCNWDAWAGHVKKKVVRKPRPYTVDVVAQKMREAIIRGQRDGESVREIKASERFAADIARAQADHEAEKRAFEASMLIPVADRIAEELKGGTPPPGTERIVQGMNGESPRPVTMADLLRS
ncbi:MAG TPA: hypothetical protein VMZ71_02340 [Gemmataceae bacterium]|nr:hypothetical protein [Gemmataceae bacterium]